MEVEALILIAKRIFVSHKRFREVIMNLVIRDKNEVFICENSVKEKLTNQLFTDEEYFYNIIHDVEDLIKIKKIFPDKEKLIMDQFLNAPDKFFKIIVLSPAQLKEVIINFSDYKDIIIKKFSEQFFSDYDYFLKFIKSFYELNKIMKDVPEYELRVKKELFCFFIYNDSIEEYFFRVIFTIEDLKESTRLFPEKKELFLKNFLSAYHIFSRIVTNNQRLQQAIECFHQKETNIQLNYYLIISIKSKNFNDLKNIKNIIKNHILKGTFDRVGLELFLDFFDDSLRNIEDNNSEYFKGLKFLRNYLGKSRIPQLSYLCSRVITQHNILNDNLKFSIAFQYVKSSQQIDELFYKEKYNLQKNKIILAKVEKQNEWYILGKNYIGNLVCGLIEENSELSIFLKYNNLTLRLFKNKNSFLAQAVDYWFVDTEKWSLTALQKAKEYLGFHIDVRVHFKEELNLNEFSTLNNKLSFG